MSKYDYHGERRQGPYYGRYKEPEYVTKTTRVDRHAGPPVSKLSYEPRDDSIDSDDGYYSDNYYRPDHRRRRSIVDRVKEFGEDLGAGSVVAAVTGGGRPRSRSEHRSNRHHRRRARSYDDYDDDWRPRSRRRSSKRWKQTAKVAAVAGAVEAFRSRNDRGQWTGAKGARVATATLAAAGIDSFLDKDPDKHSKRHIAESAIVGLIGNRIASGPHIRS